MQGIDCLWELVCRGTNRLFKSFGQVNRPPPHYEPRRYAGDLQYGQDWFTPLCNIPGHPLVGPPHSAPTRTTMRHAPANACSIHVHPPRMTDPAADRAITGGPSARKGTRAH